jgi:chemotaxis protein methyltransferase CheR/type IV pilus assembly protein PilK
MEAYSAHAQRGDRTRPAAALPAPALDGRQVAKWIRLVDERTGLYIAPERHAFLRDAVRAGLRASGCATLDGYYSRLAAGNADSPQWSLLVDRLTVPETCFFRQRASLRLMRELRVQAAADNCPRYRVMSVGCATGEEPYSLAMSLDAGMHDLRGSRGFSVTGSDISTAALRHARRGRYLMRRLDDIPEDFRDRYCRVVSSRHFEIADFLRSRVHFTRINVRKPGNGTVAGVNLIFCQNLLIYYDRARRLEIVDRLAEYLLPGGVLILGAGELLDWRHANMERLCYPDTLAYRRSN